MNVLSPLDMMTNPLRKFRRATSVRVAPARHPTSPVKLYRSKSDPKSLLSVKLSKSASQLQAPSSVKLERKNTAPRTPNKIYVTRRSRKQDVVDPPSIFDLPPTKVSDHPVPVAKRPSVVLQHYLDDFHVFFSDYGDQILEDDMRDMLKIIEQNEEKPKKHRRRRHKLPSVPEEPGESDGSGPSRISSLARIFRSSKRALRRSTATPDFFKPNRTPTVSTISQMDVIAEAGPSNLQVPSHVRKRSPRRSPVIKETHFVERKI